MEGIRNTSNDTFRRLLGNGMHYQIPKYQRDYSWDIEQWSDLWYDIQQLIKDEAPHYMGYLVLQTVDDKNFQVIDGQQRLTTICILILSVIKQLLDLPGNEKEKDNNKKRAETIRATYIGNIDILTLTSVNKLVLNRNNNAFFANYLVPLKEMPNRGLNVSEKLMKKAFETFSGYVKNEYKTAESLITFIDIIADQLFFTVITVSDELNAFKVFETLNARGVQLSSSDLLKNYIFSVADSADLHKNQMDYLENEWAKIADILKGQQVSEYLRIYWNSTHKTVRKNELYRTIRDDIKTSEQAFALLNDLEKKANLYVALQEPADEFWKNRRNIQEQLGLLELFNVRQPFSLLLSAYSALSDKEFESLLAKIVVISFRYNIIGGKNPNEQETAYNKLALKIASERKFSIEDLKKQIYISDEEFEQSFAYKEFPDTTRNNTIAKYIIARIEKFDTATSLDVSGYTLERILPDSPDETVWQWDDGKVQQYRYRLGNMALLEAGKNNSIGNASFSEKKKVYKKSSVPGTKRIGDSDISDWTENEIDAHQKRMAAAAKGIWKL
ncbi:MAG TPA: DUF262 domain-containing protein [Treponema sp.]|nr:DUF262 domain-containing protein [Treponema sp.]